MSIRNCASALLTVVTVCGSIHVAPIAAQESQSSSPQQKIVIEADGTVEAPARSVPDSSFLSPEAKAYVTEHLVDMENPGKKKGIPGVPGFMMSMLDYDNATFAVDRKDGNIAGVHTYVYLPRAGVPPRNSKRVLINLHGGGFSGCWPGCAELESMPISALMQVKVVTVDYREGPENKFPAASEDVAKVYQELLKTYKPRNIGIYGCSAGGMLTAMSLAWFETHNLPTPGAAGIYCASAGGFGGDASFIAYPLGEARIPAAHPPNQTALGYLSAADPKDPLVAPVNSPQALAKFPPTLLITATRDFAMSGALNTNIALTKAGVDSELYVWDGLFHGFFYNANVPESRDAFSIMIKFFDRHLGKE